QRYNQDFPVKNCQEYHPVERGRYLSPVKTLPSTAPPQSRTRVIPSHRVPVLFHHPDEYAHGSPWPLTEGDLHRLLFFFHWPFLHFQLQVHRYDDRFYRYQVCPCVLLIISTYS